MWRPKNPYPKTLIDEVSGVEVADIRYELWQAGAYAMHKADVEWLKEHWAKADYTKEGREKITLEMEKGAWQAFTGGEQL